MGARARSGAAAARRPGVAAPTSTEPPTAAEVFRKSRLLGICERGMGGPFNSDFIGPAGAPLRGRVDESEVVFSRRGDRSTCSVGAHVRVMIR